MFLYLSLALGIIIGLLIRKPQKVVKLNDKFTLFGILSLLFMMGISIGTNKEILSKLHILGFRGLVYAVFTVLGSITFVHLLTRGKKS